MCDIWNVSRKLLFIVKNPSFWTFLDIERGFGVRRTISCASRCQSFPFERPPRSAWRSTGTGPPRPTAAARTCWSSSGRTSQSVADPELRVGGSVTSNPPPPKEKPANQSAKRVNGESGDPFKNGAPSQLFFRVFVNLGNSWDGGRPSNQPPPPAATLWLLPVSPTVVPELVDRTNFSFLYAPAFHPALRNVAKVRQDLGTKPRPPGFLPLSFPDLALLFSLFNKVNLETLTNTRPHLLS